MKVFVLCECGYEGGDVEVIGAFTTRDKAKKERLHQMNKNKDLKWIWYLIQEVEVK